MEKPKLLMLVSRFPYPLEKGDKLRAYHQLKELSKFYHVTLIALSDRSVCDDHYLAVKKYCTDVQIVRMSLLTKSIGILRSMINGNPFQVGYFYTRSCQSLIDREIRSNDFQHIYCQLIRTSEYVKNHHGVSKTLDYMDALATGVQKRIQLQPFYTRWLFRMESNRLFRYEQRIFDYFEHHTIISDQDRDRIRHPEARRISIIPNGIQDSFFAPNTATKKYDLAFVGNMNYPPNIIAVEYIVHQLLPSLPDCNLLIAGANPSERVLKLRSDKVHVSGWMEDIRAAYWETRIFIAPMQIGTGLQNKLLEAMASSTPCITTTMANNALGAVHLRDILIADNKEDMVQMIKDLLENDQLRNQIATNGQVFVREKFNWEHTVQDLVSVMKNEK